MGTPLVVSNRSRVYHTASIFATQPRIPWEWVTPADRNQWGGSRRIPPSLLQAFRNDAKLLHQAQIISHRPMFDGFAVPEASEMHLGLLK